MSRFPTPASSLFTPSSIVTTARAIGGKPEIVSHLPRPGKRLCHPPRTRSPASRHVPAGALPGKSHKSHKSDKSENSLSRRGRAREGEGTLAR
jgi:hypothetical protein